MLYQCAAATLALQVLQDRLLPAQKETCSRVSAAAPDRLTTFRGPTTRMTALQKTVH